MPCYDSRDDASVVSQDLKEAQGYIDKLTKLLCMARKLYYDESMAVPAELDAWWEEYQRIDRGRSKR